MPIPVYALLAVIVFALIAVAIGFISKLIRNRLIRNALKKLIIPELKRRGTTYSHNKYLRSFSGSERTTFIVSKNGRPDLTIMLEVFYLDGKEQRSMVAEIKVIALIVRSVTFND